MDKEIEKIEIAGKKIDKKPNKYSLNQSKITITSDAYPNPTRDEYSFNGWVKVDSIEKIPENPSYIKDKVYNITPEDKVNKKPFIFIASWSRNSFQTNTAKNIYSGNSGNVSSESKIFVKDDFNIKLGNSLMYNLSNSEKTEEYITINLDNNIDGELIVECSNALVYEDTKKSKYLSKLVLDGRPKTFYIFPKNIEEDKGLGAFSVKLGNKRVLKEPITISGEWYPTYKKIKTKEIQLDPITGKKIEFKESNEVLAEYFNVGNSINLKNTVVGIDNTDKTGRNLEGYMVDKTSETLDIGDNVRPNVTQLGLPNDEYNVILTPVYKLRNYKISYTSDKISGGYNFEDKNSFPESYDADNPKELNNGINKYYEQDFELNWKVTDKPEKGSHLESGMFIKGTDTNNTYTNWKDGYKELRVNLEVLNVINYTNYNGNILAGESDVELNNIKDAAKAEAISDKSSSEIGYIKKLAGEKIELSSPQDILNYSFIGFYEPISNTTIRKDVESGKYTYTITGNEGDTLEFYSIWDNDVNGFTVTLDDGINCSVTAEDSTIEKFEVQDVQ